MAGRSSRGIEARLPLTRASRVFPYLTLGCWTWGPRKVPSLSWDPLLLPPDPRYTCSQHSSSGKLPLTSKAQESLQSSLLLEGRFRQHLCNKVPGNPTHGQVRKHSCKPAPGLAPEITACLLFQVDPPSQLSHNGKAMGSSEQCSWLSHLHLPSLVFAQSPGLCLGRSMTLVLSSCKFL